jgi:hypothetical protein
MNSSPALFACCHNSDLQKVYNIHPELAGSVTLQKHTFVVKWEKLKQINRRRKRVQNAVL